VLIEVGCETDFVARTEAFQALVRDLAMHIAASNPLGVAEADVPAEIIARERSVFLEQVRNEGKPEAMHDKIVEGKVKRFYKDHTLMAQPFVKNPEQTIEQLVTDVSAKTGERIVVRRFTRYELGG
jgi:elongation factor Ts